jgi:hypothetical protein
MIKIQKSGAQRLLITLYNLPHFTKASWRDYYITGQNIISHISLSIQKLGKLCGTPKALQYFLSLICASSTRSVLICQTTNTTLVMHFASSLFPVLPGGVNPISLPGYPSSSDPCLVHTFSIFYFTQSFGLHFLPYFFILQSIKFTPKTFLYRTHIF